MHPTRSLTAPLAGLLVAAALAACPESPVSKVHSSIAVEPLTVDFGALAPGAKATRKITVSNTGAYQLNLVGAEIQSDARKAFGAGAVPESIVAGGSVTVEVTYTAPSSEGPDGAQWVLESDADNAPQVAVSLSGRTSSPCLTGFSDCSGTCKDLQSDDAHCGECNKPCVAPDSCLAGKCGCAKKTCADLGECGVFEDGCGGSVTCGPCTSPAICLLTKCAPPSCTDDVLDQDETDVDCGGSCPPCPLDKKCKAKSDCEAKLVCIDGICSHCRTNADCPSDQACKDGLCGECATRADCSNGRACIGGRCLACPDEAAFNECGLCGGPAVSGKGAPCTSAPSGCQSTFACNAQQTGVECTPVAANACGLCNGAPVTGVGAKCTAQSGCESSVVCTASKDGTVCAPVAKNECGICGGTPVFGLGTNCQDASNCLSENVCNAAGLGVTCKPVGRNNCGLCGGANVAGIGDACVAANGCASAKVCGADKVSAVCDPVVKNACDKCGGPAVTGVGLTCPLANGCQSTNVCNDTKDGVVCQPVTKNECDLCGGPALPNKGTQCTDSHSCKSTWACNGAKDALVCTDVAGFGDACNDPGSGCAGTKVCDANGDLKCNAPTSCSTGTGLLISQICGQGHSGAGTTDEFIEFYNPTAAPISVGNMRVYYRSKTNGGAWTNAFDLVGTVPSHAYLLAVYNGVDETYSFTKTADITYSSLNIGDEGQLLVWAAKVDASLIPVSPTPSMQNYVDFVGYGAAVKYEGTGPASGTGVGGSIIRKANNASTTSTMSWPSGSDFLNGGNGIDTNDNGADFLRLNAGFVGPRNSGSPAKP